MLKKKKKKIKITFFSLHVLVMHTDLEALHVRQRRLRFDHIFPCSIDLKALHHI